MTSRNPRLEGWGEVRRRLPAHPWIKLVGISVFMTVFFTAYFAVLQHPAFPVTTMPLLPLDGMIGFNPGALGWYVSLWLLAILPPALMDERVELFRYATAAGILASVGLVIFWFWPTAIPRWEIEANPHWAFAYLRQIDATGNACPSLHAAFAVFAAAWLGGLWAAIGAGWAGRVLAWGWALAILYSTIATRQHVVLDVAAGALLGGLVAAIFPRSKREARVPAE